MRRRYRPAPPVGRRPQSAGDGLRGGYAATVLLDPDVAQIVAIAAAGVAVLALLGVLVLTVRLRSLRRPARRRPVDTDELAELAARVAELESLPTVLRTTESGLGRVRDDLRGAIRHVAVVRYDAFSDMGGRLSYSVALLDGAGDGLILTAINGRNETRTYCKGIVGGSSETALSPEEEEAIGVATDGRPRTPAPAPAAPSGRRARRDR